MTLFSSEPGEMPQKSLASLFENERHKASVFRVPPGVQLNHILSVVNAPLKGWQIPQSFHRTNNAYSQQMCWAVRWGIKRSRNSRAIRRASPLVHERSHL